MSLITLLENLKKKGTAAFFLMSGKDWVSTAGLWSALLLAFVDEQTTADNTEVWKRLAAWYWERMSFSTAS